jgi:hypothetical protein
MLAVRYGRKILSVAQTPLIQGIVVAIVVISLGGTAWSLYKWAQRSRYARV